MYEFTVNAGKCADLINLVIKSNKDKKNTFDVYYPDEYRLIGNFFIINDSEIKINLNLCLDEMGCCVDPDFIIKKIN